MLKPPNGCAPIPRSAVVVLIIQPHQRQTVGRELRSGRMDLNLVERLVHRMRFGGGVEIGDALAVETVEADVGVRAVWNSPDADDLAADHHPIRSEEHTS